MLFLRNCPRKRLREEPSTSNLRTSEMSSRCRSRRREPDRLSGKRSKRDTDKSRSCKLLRTTS